MTRKRKRSPKSSNSANSSKKQSIVITDRIKVPLSNKFSILDSETSSSSNHPNNQKQKIAPIVVTDINADIHSIATELNVLMETKIISIGKKFFVKSLDDKQKLIDALTSKKINFFYHPDGKKIFKAVLTGLPEIDTINITNCLKDTYNITVSKVTMFNTKSSSKLYLCHFDKADTNMKILNTVKVVYSHIVNWQPFKPKKPALTQCFRCTMYGHGASTCVRYAVCMLCAGEHLTNECNVINPNTENPVYKCFNCACNGLPHNHKACDVLCPLRTKYTASKEHTRNKSRNSTTSKQTNNNFTQSNDEHRYVRAPQPEPLRMSYAAATAQSNSHSQNSKTQHTKSSSTQNRNIHSTSNANNDLWSFTEVAQIMLQCIDELKQCQTKFDQLTVIANLLSHACV